MTDPLRGLVTAGIVAVIRAPSHESALRAVEALIEGGITGIEITYSTPDAAAVIATVQDRFGDSCCLGAGTVVDAGQAREAADAGATFLVSPGTEESLVAPMLATGRTVVTGALTPSEVMRATRLGSHGVKIFPASLGGPGHLRALRAPFPDVPMMPTGGVTADNLRDWFDAGAVAVGAGGDLVTAKDLADGRFEEVRAKAASFRRALDEARSAIAGGSADRPPDPSGT